MTRARLCIPFLALALVACSKKDDPPPTAKAKDEPKTKTEPKAKDEPKPEPEPEPAKPAVVDPATFVEHDLTATLPRLAATIKAPPDAKIVADELGFGDKEPLGVTVGSGDFVVHVWTGTIGGERTVVDMRAGIEEAKYTETKQEIGVIEYTIEKGGATTYGYFIHAGDLRVGEDQLLCGTARPVATPEALEPYRAACATVAKKK